MIGPLGQHGPSTSIVLESEVGDYIGGGQTYQYTQADAIITVSSVGGHLSVRIRGDESWFGEFQLPSAFSQVERGAFVDLERYPFNDPTLGGLTWFGEGRGCNAMGHFTIDEVAYESGALTRVQLSFEHACDAPLTLPPTRPPTLRGTIRWNSEDPTAPAGPVTPTPTGLWQPSGGSLPTSGNYAYLDSDPGDFIGRGFTTLYTGAQLAVSGNQDQLTVNVGGLSGTFQAMNGLSQLQPGYYADLQGYPFHNPAKGGLNWSGNGRGCNRILGWFVLDDIRYNDGTLDAVDLRFEQRCEAGIPALHGVVHWRR